MLTLLIEASTERGVIAFFDDLRCRYKKLLPFGYANSKYLLPSIAEGLTTANIQFSDLKFITVGIGPGSYTGMRVAAVIAKGIAYAHQLPLVEVSTLKGFSPAQPGAFLSLIDAKMGGMYALQGEKNEDGDVQYFGDPAVYSLEALEALLKKVSRIVTPSSQRLRPLLEQRYPDLLIEWEESYPDASEMTRIAVSSFQRGEIKSVDNLELLYLRDWEKREKDLKDK